MKLKYDFKFLNSILRYRYIIGLIIFVILVLFKINGSSIGIWQNFVTTNSNSHYSENLIGKSRMVRTDEWEVQTPFYLAQAMGSKYYPVENDDITSSGENMIVSYNAPVKDISVISKPFNWGFLLLGKDYGLAWYWGMKFILLMLLSFEMCMILTKQDKLISVLGAFWISLSPAVQWWFMQHVGDLVLYMEAIIVSFYYMLKKFDSLKHKILFSCVFALSSVGFALVLYPALQVPLAYLTLIFMILIYTDFKDRIKIKIKDVFLFGFILLFIILMLVHVILISKDALKALLNTAYPGKRISVGGGLSFYYINLFLTNIFLPYKDITFLNNCEVSSIYNFLPAVILALPVLLKKHVKDLKYGIVLSICALLQIYFMMFKISPIIAKVTFLSYVVVYRMPVAYALTSAYLSIWMLSILNRNKCLNKIYSILVSILISIFYYLTIINSPMKSYVKLKWYILLIVVLFMLNFLLLQGKKVLFSILMIVIIFISGATVNPIARGTGAIYNNNLSCKIQSIKQNDPSSEWISSNDIMGAFLYANGVKTIGGTNFYPDLKKWYKLDINKSEEYIYNRYEHINFVIQKENSSFKLLAPDSIQVNINPKDLKKYKIKYVLTKDDLQQFNIPKKITFKNIYPRDKDGFYIFKVLYY